MIANIEPNPAKASVAAYRLKIVLNGTKPPVWRRLQVPGNANLGWLHAVLQVTMGWTNSHLHHFFIGDVRYSDPRCNDDPALGEESERDEAKTTLAQAVPQQGARFRYEYDFGDSWEHIIKVEKILPPNPVATTTACCLEGARACPPEDCGGVWGYADLLKVIKQPKHEEHESMMEWLGGGFDALAFDLEKTNTCLRKLKWPRVTESQLRKVLMARDGYRE